MIKLQAKRFELNFLLKLSHLKSNSTLTLGDLNPALNNLGHRSLPFRQNGLYLDILRIEKLRQYNLHQSGIQSETII